MNVFLLLVSYLLCKGSWHALVIFAEEEERQEVTKGEFRDLCEKLVVGLALLWLSAFVSFLIFLYRSCKEFFA